MLHADGWLQKLPFQATVVNHVDPAAVCAPNGFQDEGGGKKKGRGGEEQKGRGRRDEASP